MKDIFLKLLAKEVLFYSREPLSKVRFAKVLYFVFKSLVQEKTTKSTDLLFIRMPLGPVPDGFMDLNSDSDFGVLESNVGLLYNRQSYYLNNKDNFKTTVNSAFIKQVLARLESFSTSSLVELSHLDDSWITHANGQSYYINSEDLKNLLPRSGKAIDSVIDNQLIQAKLLSGSENDIVINSTNLEYPEYLDAE